MLINITFSTTASSIKNTLIVPVNAIGDLKLEMTFGEATKKLDRNVFYVYLCVDFCYLHINKISDNIPLSVRKKLQENFLILARLQTA